MNRIPGPGHGEIPPAPNLSGDQLGGIPAAPNLLVTMPGAENDGSVDPTLALPVVNFTEAQAADIEKQAGGLIDKVKEFAKHGPYSTEDEYSYDDELAILDMADSISMFGIGSPRVNPDTDEPIPYTADELATIGAKQSMVCDLLQREHDRIISGLSGTEQERIIRQAERDLYATTHRSSSGPKGQHRWGLTGPRRVDPAFKVVTEGGRPVIKKGVAKTEGIPTDSERDKRVGKLAKIVGKPAKLPDGREAPKLHDNLDERHRRIVNYSRALNVVQEYIANPVLAAERRQQLLAEKEQAREAERLAQEEAMIGQLATAQMAEEATKAAVAQEIERRQREAQGAPEPVPDDAYDWI